MVGVNLRASRELAPYYARVRLAEFVAALRASPGLTPAMQPTIVQRLSCLLAVLNFVRKETSVRPSPATAHDDTSGIPHNATSCNSKFSQVCWTASDAKPARCKVTKELIPLGSSI